MPERTRVVAVLSVKTQLQNVVRSLEAVSNALDDSLANADDETDEYGAAFGTQTHGQSILDAIDSAQAECAHTLGRHFE